MSNEIRFNVFNFEKIVAGPPAYYDVIRFDSNNQCNVHCVYCHNPRSDELIDIERFRSFLSEKVLGVGFFQFGCQMEPTLDPRLSDFMLAVAASPAKPTRGIRLQTNGILLHRHPPEKLVEAGLTLATISVDSVDASTHKGLRGGTSLAKVQRNIVEFRRSCPSVRIGFITVVTSDNIDDCDDLVAWGVAAGVAKFEFRQVVHQPLSGIVDHGRMEKLLITSEKFDEMRDRIKSKYGETTALYFSSNNDITSRASWVRNNSLMSATGRGAIVEPPH
jgi:MoaA/NifB/PqqE/SkfB family radical SAM enzyme